MAAVASTPLHLRRTRPAHSTAMDTPTPSTRSHSGIFSSSIKLPSISNSTSFTSKPNNFTTKTTATSTRQPLGSLNSAALDQLEIATDGTERQRRTLEEEIRRGLGEFDKDEEGAVAGAQSEVESLGYGDLDDLEQEGRYGLGHDRRGEMRDESVTSESERGGKGDEERRSFGDDFETQTEEIVEAMAGTRQPSHHYQSQRQSQPQPEAELDPTRDDLSFLSNLSRSRSTSPAPPPPHRPSLHHQQPQRTSPNSLAAEFLLRTNPSPASPDKTPRLPDTTGLTAGLISPRSVRRPAPVTAAGAAGRKVQFGPGAAAGSASSAEGLAASNAISSLQSKLSSLEREAKESRAKVAQLEAQLFRQAPPQRQRDDEQAWESKLEEERQRRIELETHLSQLRARVAALQPSSAAAELPQVVRELRHDLDLLGEEVDGVKGVVEGLLYERLEREERVRARRSPAPAPELERQEEGKRKAAEYVSSQQQQMEQDPDRTPGASRKQQQQEQHLQPQREQAHEWKAPESPKVGRSFVDATEIDRLRLQILEAEQRRLSPRPRAQVQPTRTQSQPQRAATAPPPAPTAQPTTAETSWTSASYSSDSASQQQQQQHRHHHHHRYQHSSATELEQEEDEQQIPQPDFDRAEQIFARVPRRSGGPHKKGSKRPMCSVCRRRRASRREEGGPGIGGSAPAKLGGEWERRERARQKVDRDDEEGKTAREELQAVFDRLVNEFEGRQRIFYELSAQFRAMTWRSPLAKRQTLAAHLHECMDVLDGQSLQLQRLHEILHHGSSHGHYSGSARFEGREREGVV